VAVCSVPSLRPGDGLVRAPKQERSRQSLDRAVDAAVALLIERGSGAFTVADVARLANVSTGSLYGRLASKDDLIRVAHAREMDRLGLATALAFSAVPEEGIGLEDGVRFAVRTLADLLAHHARLLAAFMIVGRDDPAVAARGSAAHQQMQDAFVGVLQGRTSAATGDACGDDGLSWACVVAYSVLARQLGLGNDPGAAADYDLDHVVDHLTTMLTAYVVNPALRGPGT